LGLALCAALGACTLTSAPSSLAQREAGQPITFRFQDLELRAVFQILADFSGTNIVIADQVPSVNVTMAARDVPWNEVLEKLASCVGAELDRRGNVIAVRPATKGAAVSECGDIELSEGRA
jgi:type II secretory pathway component HofQ